MSQYFNTFSILKPFIVFSIILQIINHLFFRVYQVYSKNINNPEAVTYLSYFFLPIITSSSINVSEGPNLHDYLLIWLIVPQVCTMTMGKHGPGRQEVGCRGIIAQNKFGWTPRWCKTIHVHLCQIHVWYLSLCSIRSAANFTSTEEEGGRC